MQIDTRAEPLRVRIRRALDLGNLPTTSGIKVSGGCGAATQCACCDRPIRMNEVRLIMARPRNPDSPGDPIAMHPQCAQVWFDEAERRIPPVSCVIA